MSDFVLFPNAFREIAAALPSLSERADIRFSEYLIALGRQRPVRLITTHTATSDAFAAELRARLAEIPASTVAVRYAPSEVHEKGILAPAFYISGSMNITHSGVYVRGEKLTYHAAGDTSDDRVARAYHEFDRQWAMFQ